MEALNYVTGNNCETFTSLSEAKQYADKCNDKSITVYKDGLYLKTIHKSNGEWELKFNKLGRKPPLKHKAMKVKIIKKQIKEGDNYCIKSLLVSFTGAEIYSKIVAKLKSLGATDEQVNRFSTPNEYNGQTSYAFFLNCSHFTFDRVARFGILDANIIFSINDKGYCNAKIQVIDRKEKINGYEEPEDEVTGWATEAPEPKKAEEKEPEPVPIVAPEFTPLSNLQATPVGGSPVDGNLPF